MREKNLIKSWSEQHDPVSEELNCPNCWGRQEYDGQYCDARIQKKIDLKNAEVKLGWILAYVIKKFDGIKPTGTTVYQVQGKNMQSL